jgi:plasmid stability protein
MGEGVMVMAAITVRNLDDRLKERLRVRAARHGHSMEAEAREILADALTEPGDANLVRVLRSRFAELGGVDLDLPRRNTPVRAADFS